MDFNHIIRKLTIASKYLFIRFIFCNNSLARYRVKKVEHLTFLTDHEGQTMNS